MRIKFENEDKFEDYLEELFKSYDWCVKRQVECDKTKQWTHPWKIDMVVWNNSLPELGYIGIELKISTFTKGAKMYKAFVQMDKYRHETFDGHKLDKVCLAIAERKSQLNTFQYPSESAKSYYEKERKAVKSGAMIFLQAFLFGAKFGWIEFIGNTPRIKFVSSHSNYIIPLSLDRYVNDFDIKKINERHTDPKT